MYTHNEVIKIASIAHAAGWNDKASDLYGFSDTSYNSMLRKLRELELLNPECCADAIFDTAKTATK